MSANPSFLIAATLHELAEDAEGLLALTAELDGLAAEIRASTNPKVFRASASLVKNAAIQILLAASSMVGTAERLRIVAEFGDYSGGELPS